MHSASCITWGTNRMSTWKQFFKIQSLLDNCFLPRTILNLWIPCHLKEVKIHIVHFFIWSYCYFLSWYSHSIHSFTFKVGNINWNQENCLQWDVNSSPMSFELVLHGYHFNHKRFALAYSLANFYRLFNW